MSKELPGQIKRLYKEQMTINKCLKKLILLGQIFGYFPVQDISASNQKFSYKSLRVFYSICSAIGPAFLCVMQLNKVVTTEFNIFQAQYICNYIVSTYIAVVLIQLSKHWPKLMDEWGLVEIKMRSYGFPRKLNKHIVCLMIIFMISAFVESLLHQASRIYRVIECHHDAENAIKFFFGNLTLSHIFQYIPYNIPTSLLIQFTLLQMQFAFTYIDLFVVVISMCLASRIKQVRERIEIASERQISDIELWINLRKDYTRLSTLCQQVNDKISNIILVSFFPNIFTILIQVYNSIKPKQNYIESVYFYFSLIFLIGRTATVCICGAMIYEESREPLGILNTVSYKIYNREIAGAIVTYELVLIQFNQEYLNSGSKSERCN